MNSIPQLGAFGYVGKSSYFGKIWVVILVGGCLFALMVTLFFWSIEEVRK